MISVIFPTFGMLGVMIFVIDVLNSSNPTKIISISTINPATYSSRPWPCGCSLSTGFDAKRNPISAMIAEPASEMLLNASAVIATDAAIKPTVSLPIKSSTLTIMPTAPASVAYFPRRAVSSHDLFFMNNLIPNGSLYSLLNYLLLLNNCENVRLTHD